MLWQKSASTTTFVVQVRKCLIRFCSQAIVCAPQWARRGQGLTPESEYSSDGHAGMARKNPRISVAECRGPSHSCGRSRQINFGRFHSNLTRANDGLCTHLPFPASIPRTLRVWKRPGKSARVVVLHTTIVVYSVIRRKRRETRGDSFGWPPVDFKNYCATRPVRVAILRLARI